MKKFLFTKAYSPFLVTGLCFAIVVGWWNTFAGLSLLLLVQLIDFYFQE